MPEFEKSMPAVYLQDKNYAAENDELDQWRESRKLNEECARAIDNAINENYTYENSHLDTEKVIDKVSETYGKERTELVFANHVANREWDGRYSSQTKEWANNITAGLSPDVKNEIRNVHLNAHATLIDGVIRTVINRERELSKDEKNISENSTASKVNVDFHPRRLDEFIMKEAATGYRIMTGTRKELLRFSKDKLAASVKIPELEVLIDKAETARQNHIAEMKAKEIAMESEFLDSKGCIAAIYQIQNLPENRDISFMDMDYLKKKGLEPDRNNYSLVYTFEVLPEDLKDKDTFLNQVYAKFNLDHPKDFTGHSLSVSDVIVIKNHDEITSHFIDSFDFAELKDFIKERENPLKTIEDTVEQNDNHLDGVINNTPEKTERKEKDIEEDKPARKRSISSYLKESKCTNEKNKPDEKSKTKSKEAEL